jgi:hypothetical protein
VFGLYVWSTQFFKIHWSFVFEGGVRHKEIFSFTRTKQGSFKGDEWNFLVKPVIQRWGRFVRMVDEELAKQEGEDNRTAGDVK